MNFEDIKIGTIYKMNEPFNACGEEAIAEGSYVMVAGKYETMIHQIKVFDLSFNKKGNGIWCISCYKLDTMNSEDVAGDTLFINFCEEELEREIKETKKYLKRLQATLAGIRAFTFIARVTKFFESFLDKINKIFKVDSKYNSKK